MEGLTAFSIGGRLPLRFPSTLRKHRSLSHHHRRPRFQALASGDGPELDKWDRMELKFGRLLGEDPKLTLAKIMARKANPNVSYLEVEKSFLKNKGKLDESMFNMPTDLNVETSDDYAKVKNLNLSRPSMRKGVKATAELNLSPPAMIKGGNATRPVERPASVGLPHQPLHSSSSSSCCSDVKSVDSPNVALRKLDVVQEDDESDRRSKLRNKPNLVLKMRQDRDEDLSDMTLLKKLELVQKPLEPDQENVSASGPVLADALKPSSPSEMLQDKPETINASGPSKSVIDFIAESPELDRVDMVLQPPEQRSVESDNVEDSSTDEKSLRDSNDVSRQVPMMGKPQRT